MVVKRSGSVRNLGEYRKQASELRGRRERVASEQKVSGGVLKSSISA